MYTVSRYPHGTFSWADNSSRDAAAAKAFYQGLFGWDKDEFPLGGDMTYTMFKQDGAYVAGFSAMMPEMMEQDVPSHWRNYVSVNDADALVDVIREHGGEIVFGPMDVFTSGRMAQFIDPTGAMLGLWQPCQHIGAGIVNTAGAMCWNELLTRDAEAAQAFYGTVFGWDFETDANSYIIIKNRGRNNGAMMQMDESFGDMPSVWQPYFSVADIDASIARAVELGGRMFIPKTEAPGAGHFAYFSDTAGARFYIIQLTAPEAWEE